MSAETDLIASLAGNAGVSALAGNRVSINAADQQAQGAVQPYVVVVTSTEYDRGLDGTLLGTTISADLQCWAGSAVQAAALADAVMSALADGPWVVTGRSNGFDAETGQDATVINATLLLG